MIYYDLLWFIMIYYDLLWFISLQFISTIFRQVISNIAIREAVCTVSTGTDNR